MTYSMTYHDNLLACNFVTYMLFVIFQWDKNNQIDRAFISGTLFVTRRGIPAIIRGEKSVTLIS